jgi:integrase
MAKLSKLLTTSRQEVAQKPQVKAFLQRKSRNSQNTADAYLLALAALQEFLNTDSTLPKSYSGVDIDELGLVFVPTAKRKSDVYEFLDAYISYLTNIGLSPNSIGLYIHGVKGYLEHCDVEINPTKFKNKVTMPKNHREDEAAIDDTDIRKILLACSNLRLKVYLLILASGGLRAREALAIRLKDIDFSVTPTKVHIRKEYTKTKVARDIYISEEATTYLQQFINWKYSTHTTAGQIRRVKDQDDLIFRIHRQNEFGPKWMYNKMLLSFQSLLKTIGLEERKEGMRRRKITLHSLRRFAKTVIATQTSTDYSEWFLGHSKSPYFVQKEAERRLIYATKCMPFLTFINYSKLEQDATVKQTELQMLMMKDANKDREIELLKQRVQVKDKEIELLKQRDSINTDAIGSLTDKFMQVMAEVEELKKKTNNHTTS